MMDARALDADMVKALAHPLRIQLLERLRDHGHDTASGLGRRVGQSSGTTSYHLRRLADVGLIVEAHDVGTRRDRYWRAAGGLTLGRELFEEPSTRPAAQVVQDELSRLAHERARGWLVQRHQWPEAWQDAAVMAHVRLDLTVPQLVALAGELLGVLERYRDLPVESDSTRIATQVHAFPFGSPPGGSPG